MAADANQMKTFARLQFQSFAIKVPDQWKVPSGDPGAKHYADAFKPGEKATVPLTMPPALFLAHSTNKYHTDIQKTLNNIYTNFIDDMCDAICSAWQQSQSLATMVGVMINAVTASAGQVVWPPLTPMIMLTAPKKTPAQLKYSTVIATVLGNAWQQYTMTIKVPGLPWYPAFAAFPAPIAVPAPNIPCPVATLTQVTASVSKRMMKQQMCQMLADPKAQYHEQLFDSLCDAFEKCFQIWQTSTQVMNVLGTGPIPTFAPPYVPVGPVVGGVGAMMPGGFVTMPMPMPPPPPPAPLPPPIDIA
ncbi:MAG: hypothetical protein ABI867_25590 [Kofleriaceae bacterium]